MYFLSEHVVEVHIGHGEPQAGIVELGQGEQILHQVAHAAGLKLQHPARVPPGTRGRVGCRDLQCRGQGGQRTAQFVAGVGDETTLGLVR